MKKRKRQTFVFSSTWSNHPEGRDYKGWENEEAPPEKYYSETFGEYLPNDADTQKPTASGYYRYPDGTKVKIEEFGNTKAPYGKYIKKIHMIFPINS